MKMNLKLEMVPISKLKPWDKNPKKHDIDAIIASMKRYGYTDPILAERGTGRILAGHGRIEALKKMGETEVPVIYLNIHGKDADAYTIIDNQTTMMEGWDDKALKLIIEDLRLELPDLNLVDFDLDDIVPQTVIEDEVPEPPKVAKSKRGEIYVLGRHRLMCGDATSAEDVAALMGRGRADMVFTSPPYNVDLGYASYDDDKSSVEYANFIFQSLIQITDALKDGRAIFWNIGVRTDTNTFSHIEAFIKLKLRYYRQIIWKKSGVCYPVFKTTKHVRQYNPNYQHEIIYIVTKGKLERGIPLPNIIEAYQNDVWEIHQSKASTDLKTVSYGKYGFDRHAKKEHPAPYPKELVIGGLHYMTEEGESVLDPFGGSGTTLIACEQLNRVCYMMEIDPIYVDVIIARWEKLTGKKAVRA